MKGGLSKLGTALIIIFVISMVALLAELVYVICRRRAFRRRTSTATGDHLSQFSSSDSTPSSVASSKELLYFFCIRSQPPRLDHTSSIVERSPEVEVIDIDLMKIQGVFGPPRFLFTIKEEEKEGFESPAGGVGRMSLEECFKKAVGIEEEEEEEAVVIEVGGGGGEDATPFSTPCASPVYFTPSDSPAREVVVNVESTGESRISGTAASRRVEV